MSAEKDYVLGTDKEELTRLGLQHRVWRSATLNAWARAGMTQGSRVVDFGAGPGYATINAAEIVGAQGKVLAIERSDHFLHFAQQQIEHRGLSWVRFHQADLMEDHFPVKDFDVAWCRWVACFVSSPQKLVQHIAASLRVGGKVVFHEYADYASWRVIPQSTLFQEFVAEVMASWRASGGEPDIALALPPLLNAAGLKVIESRPLVFTATPKDYGWQWPAAFIKVNPGRLAELGRVTPQWAEAVREDFRKLEQNPDSIILTPLVMELIAERVS